jgi:hypothetical protein
MGVDTRVNTHIELQATRDELKEALIAKENALKQLAEQNAWFFTSLRFE